MRRAGRIAAAAGALLLACAPALSAGQERDPFAARAAVSAEDLVALLSDICLDGMPGFSGAAGRLDRRGFGAADAAGFRLHAERALMAMASPAEQVEPPAAATCMVMAPDIAFAAARERVEPVLEARTDELASAQSAALDLPHRVWRWPEGDHSAQLVLARDGQGNLAAVVTVQAREDAS